VATVINGVGPRAIGHQRAHGFEIILPNYDCMRYDRIEKITRELQ